MTMQIIDAQQGSHEWLAIRAKHFTGSEASAMLGLSPYMTRNDLLKQKATGIVPEVSSAQQRLYDRGHVTEELTRPIVEEDIGEELYPATCSREVDGLPLLASYDGLTMDEAITWEHKLWNESLAQAVLCGEVPDSHWPQLEQGLLVSGASRCRFTVSDGEGRKVDCWYASVPERRARLIAGWKQFQIDLANYQHVEHAPEAVAAPQEYLPAVSITVNGRIALKHNLIIFGNALTDYVEKINKKPETDQDFADLEATVKTLKEAEERLDAAESGALAQVEDIDAMRRAVAHYRDLARSNRLVIEKLVKSEKENRRAEIVRNGQLRLTEHIAALNTRIGKPYMPTVHADFAGAVKNKRTIASLHDAVDTELARCKIAANEVADLITGNLNHLRETATDYVFLFADTAQIVLKPADDFALLVKSRIDEHKAEVKRKAEEKAAQELIESVRKAEADLKAAEAAKQVIATAQAAPVVQAVQPAPIAAPAPVKSSAAPTMKLGTIADRLGFALPAEFLKSLGFEGQRVKGACLFHESDFPLICDALQRHIEAAKQKVAA